MSETTKNINLIFYYLCLICAVALAIWCIHEYCHNYDVTEVSFKAFHSEEKGYDNQYPSMTMCIVDAYNDVALRMYNGSTINLKSYSEFLLGKYWIENMLSVRYDLVTIDVRDYIIGECILPVGSESECHKFGPIRQFTRLSSLGVMECFSFQHVIDDVVDEVFIALNNSIHPNGLRPTIDGFLVLFHYPHQITRGHTNVFYTWPKRSTAMDDYYKMHFYLSNVEILKRRMDGREQCYDWKDYDIKVIEDVMRLVGCRPPYWKSKYDHPECKSQAQLTDTKLQFLGKVYGTRSIPPCTEITKMDVRYEEKVGERNYLSVLENLEKTAGTKKGWFVINISFWQATKFKEILKVKAYTFQNMIGNSGGYIGLLVGVTISDFLCFVLKMYNAIKGIFSV